MSHDAHNYSILSFSFHCLHSVYATSFTIFLLNIIRAFPPPWVISIPSFMGATSCCTLLDVADLRTTHTGTATATNVPGNIPHCISYNVDGDRLHLCFCYSLWSCCFCHLFSVCLGTLFLLLHSSVLIWSFTGG